LFTLGVAGNLMEAGDAPTESAQKTPPTSGPAVLPAVDHQAAPGRADAHAAPPSSAKESPTVQRDPAPASPTSDEVRKVLAAMESLGKNVAAQIEQPATAAADPKASQVTASDPTARVGGRWYSDEDETIVFTQHGSEVTMVVTQEGVAMQGRGAITGRTVSMTLYFAEVPIGTMSLDLARDGRQLQGNMYVNNVTQPVVLRREN
jgi:hypothetical protein